MSNNINNNMNYYCAYLRKSRKDMDAEAHGQGETLARHEKILRDFAKTNNIKISKFYREVVSGETISARPVMQELLQDVEKGMWTGVLVVEVERLARGNTLDQGIVSNTFQYSNTKIITPLKTYDPNNEYDEEYFEFGLFMSRREYKKINQRLHSGIISSVKEGKHAGASAPYGYETYKLPKQKGYSLKINEEEAKMVKLIYAMYSNGSGIKAIAKELNRLGYKPRRGKSFSNSTISYILTNPTYIGKIKYEDRATIKKMIDGKVIRVKNPDKEVLYVEGVHSPIIDLDTWNKVQNIRKNNLIARTKIDYTIKNPMASILKCAICGRTMSRNTNTRKNEIRICCRNCKNIGTNIDIVETKLLQALNLLLKDYKLKLVNKDNSDFEMQLEINKNAIQNYKIELDKLSFQLNNTYDLLEQGIYSNEIFISRSSLLRNQINKLTEKIKDLEKDRDKIISSKNNKEIIIPKIEKVLDTYYETNNIELKNQLLKSVLEKVEYLKDKPKNQEDFTLKLYPKLY